MNVLEQIYAPSEVVEAYEKGTRDALREHKCPKREIVTKIKTVARKPHPRSRTLRWGIVSSGVLLNQTYKTRDEAVVALVGLEPANPKNRTEGKVYGFVIDLGKHF